MCNSTNFNVTMHVTACISCGIVFAYPDEHDGRLRENHKTFYCPNGHPQCYSIENEEEKLKRRNAELRNIVETERDATRVCRATIVTQARQISAYKGVGTKLRKQISGGVEV